MPLTSTRTPAIVGHVTRVVSSRPVPVVAAVVAAVVAVAGAARAEVFRVEGGAEVVRAAERVVPVGDGLLFPIDPIPRCEVLNNFGGYSAAFGPGGHQGLDIGAQLGQAVLAVESGVLLRRVDGSNSGRGWELLSGTDNRYRYYHLDTWADGLEEGDVVRRGQVIGTVGDTGNATPGGYHLHFEVRPGPQPQSGSADPVDPVPLLDIPEICRVYPPTR
jgi:murein DD-endopeptidase MepM/ murein hydrolase activator NlpD